MRIISEGDEWLQYYIVTTTTACQLCLIGFARLRRTSGAFEWVSDGDGGTIRGIRGGRRGNLKGDLMGDLICPGDLAAEEVDRTAWRWSEVPEGRRSSAADAGSNLSIPS